MNYLRVERLTFLLLGAILISVLLLWASYSLLFPRVTPQESPITPGTNSTSTRPSVASSTTPSSPGMKEARFVAPYPVTWKDGGVTFTLTSAALDATRLTLRFRIAMPNAALCVPLNIERLIDEMGNFARPETKQFALPNAGGCIGTPNTTYENQEVIFPVKPADLPYTLTTGGSSNIFFIVSVSDAGELNVAQPGTSD